MADKTKAWPTVDLPFVLNGMLNLTPEQDDLDAVMRTFPTLYRILFELRRETHEESILILWILLIHESTNPTYNTMYAKNIRTERIEKNNKNNIYTHWNKKNNPVYPNPRVLPFDLNDEIFYSKRKGAL